MKNFTTDTYQIKRKIIEFATKITNEVGQVEKKFVQDIIYGISKSKSILPHPLYLYFAISLTLILSNIYVLFYIFIYTNNHCFYCLEKIW